MATPLHPVRSTTRHPRLLRLAALGAAFTVAAGLAVSAAAPVHAATPATSAGSSSPTVLATAQTAAATSSSCSLADAGTGTAARDLCWLDLSGYSAVLAASPAGQHLSVAVPGGYRLDFTLRATGGALHATPLGAWPNAYLGTNGVFTGVAGSPALSQTGQNSTSRVTLSSIRLVDARGNAVKTFHLVAADAESTDAGESLAFRSNVDLASTKLGPVGVACGGLIMGFGSHAVTCTGGTQINAHHDGIASVSAAAPTTFGQTLVGAGEEGVAYAVSLSSIEVATAATTGTTSTGAGSTTADGTASLTRFAEPAGWGTTSLFTAGLLLVAAAGFVLIARRHRSGHRAAGGGHSLR
jgi:hypothetical protein